MFLLHIKTEKIKRRDLLQSIYLKNFIKNVNMYVFFIMKLKEIKRFVNLRLIISKFKNSDFKSKNTVKYILGISLYNTNIIVYLTNIKGIVKFFCTAGFLGIKKIQRNKKIAILIKLIKFTMLNVIFISKKDSIALHLKNCNQQIGNAVSSFLTKYYNFELIRISNSHCHNGCRPKKIKRKKKRKLNFEKLV